MAILSHTEGFNQRFPSVPSRATGKPELRRYAAIYMLKDQEVRQFGDDLVINCAP